MQVDTEPWLSYLAIARLLQTLVETQKSPHVVLVLLEVSSGGRQKWVENTHTYTGRCVTGCCLVVAYKYAPSRARHVKSFSVFVPQDHLVNFSRG